MMFVCLASPTHTDQRGFDDGKRDSVRERERERRRAA